MLLTSDHLKDQGKSFKHSKHINWCILNNTFNLFGYLTNQGLKCHMWIDVTKNEGEIILG
jgi:hypothetical protein